MSILLVLVVTRINPYSPVLNPAGVWPKGMSNKRMKSEMEKKQNKKAPKGRGSGKD